MENIKEEKSSVCDRCKQGPVIINVENLEGVSQSFWIILTREKTKSKELPHFKLHDNIDHPVSNEEEYICYDCLELDYSEELGCNS